MTTTRDHAILTVDGEFAGQAALSDAYHMECIKLAAREAQDAGQTVTLRKGPRNWNPTAVCPCGCVVRLAVEKKGNAHYRKGEHYPTTCPECESRTSYCNSQMNMVYSWSSVAELEAAQDWYDEQEFGFDGGF